MSRHRVSRSASKKMFRRTSAATHKLNIARAFRGGIRL